jgi:hypothetical protein
MIFSTASTTPSLTRKPMAVLLCPRLIACALYCYNFADPEFSTALFAYSTYHTYGEYNECTHAHNRIPGRYDRLANKYWQRDHSQFRWKS